MDSPIFLYFVFLPRSIQAQIWEFSLLSSLEKPRHVTFKHDKAYVDIVFAPFHVSREARAITARWIARQRDIRVIDIAHLAYRFQRRMNGSDILFIPNRRIQHFAQGFMGILDRALNEREDGSSSDVPARLGYHMTHFAFMAESLPSILNLPVPVECRRGVTTTIFVIFGPLQPGLIGPWGLDFHGDQIVSWARDTGFVPFWDRALGTEGPGDWIMDELDKHDESRHFSFHGFGGAMIVPARVKPSVD
ncbi:hypothetical protein FSPOR_6667 [Fusarium sporotrichioides]|uniref:Uncharacterized protein n=1 Tax=Fusarium sporotrichioides TaxID=5514 RepID=A0A395S2L3_FUSSP|nr:hypothetical protein FSPOR_6667 [Fusarium sporotrichioides]